VKFVITGHARRAWQIWNFRRPGIGGAGHSGKNHAPRTPRRRRNPRMARFAGRIERQGKSSLKWRRCHYQPAGAVKLKPQRQNPRWFHFKYFSNSANCASCHFVSFRLNSPVSRGRARPREHYNRGRVVPPVCSHSPRQTGAREMTLTCSSRINRPNRKGISTTAPRPASARSAAI